MIVAAEPVSATIALGVGLSTSVAHSWKENVLQTRNSIKPSEGTKTTSSRAYSLWKVIEIACCDAPDCLQCNVAVLKMKPATSIGAVLAWIWSRDIHASAPNGFIPLPVLVAGVGYAQAVAGYRSGCIAGGQADL